MHAALCLSIAIFIYSKNFFFWILRFSLNDKKYTNSCYENLSNFMSAVPWPMGYCTSDGCAILSLHFFENSQVSVNKTLVQAFMELGELLISSDAGAALDAFKTV